MNQARPPPFIIGSAANGSVSSLGGEWSEDLILLSGSLEATVTDLGGCVDELDIDSFGLPRLDGRVKRFSDDDRSLSGALNTTLDKEIVLVDFTVVGEATERSDVLDDSIGLSGGVVLNTGDGSSTNSVNLVVDVGSGVVTELTTSGDRPLDGGRMPGTDTSDLSETSMGLSVQAGDAESLDDTGHTLTTGDSDGIDTFG